MKTLNYINVVKKLIGLTGLVVAGTLVSLPASAQVPPVESPDASTEETTDSPDFATPVEAVETEAPEEAGEALDAAEPAEDSLTPDAATEEMPEPIVETEPTEAMPTEAEAPTEPTTTEAETPTTPSIAATSGTIVDIAAASESFQTLVAALTEAELAEVLQGEGPFTVFAPTDEAFAALPEGTLDELLLPENRDTLVKILTYHVVPGAIMSDELASGEVATVEGNLVNVMVDPTQETVMVNDATVIQADIPATNGVIHAIDQVILPPDL